MKRINCFGNTFCRTCKIEEQQSDFPCSSNTRTLLPILIWKHSVKCLVLIEATESSEPPLPEWSHWLKWRDSLSESLVNDQMGALAEWDQWLDESLVNGVIGDMSHWWMAFIWSNGSIDWMGHWWMDRTNRNLFCYFWLTLDELYGVLHWSNTHCMKNNHFYSFYSFIDLSNESFF